MKKSDARPCAKGPFEWKKDVLYVLGVDFDGETAWIPRDVAEAIRKSAPNVKDPSLMYLINRKEDKDDIYFVREAIGVAGGEVMCIVDKMVMQ